MAISISGNIDGIYNTGTIGAIANNNVGTISGHTYGIYNDGTIIADYLSHTGQIKVDWKY